MPLCGFQQRVVEGANGQVPNDKLQRNVSWHDTSKSVIDSFTYNLKECSFPAHDLSVSFFENQDIH